MARSGTAAKLFWGRTLFPSVYNHDYGDHTAAASARTTPSWAHQVPVYLLSGLTTELVSGVVWTPMDVAKSRLQRGAEAEAGPHEGRSARRLLLRVWRQEGWRGIFRVRLALGSAFYFILFFILFFEFLSFLKGGGDRLICLQGYWVSIAVFG